MELRDVRRLTPGIDVNAYRIVGAAPGEHIGLPSSTVTLIVDLDDGLRLSEPGSPEPRTFRTCLGGMHLDPVTIHHGGTQIGVAAHLGPAAVRALFGMPAGEFWTTNIELSDAAPGLADRLYESTVEVPHDARAAVARHVLADAVASRPPVRADPDAEQAWRVIQHERGRVTVSNLVAWSCWSARYLTKVFTAEYGIGLKQAARLARFDHARERLESGDPIATVSAVCGYADQAHLTREFAAITGHPPAQFLAVRAAEFSAEPA
ncbi:helix-turn-helix domain-containing protein [Gordonia crocea]|uniref:Putative transcriptional regulator, AraC n=1 Tax=Gordonia crocea TaxID=589162 RepID=A0A7M3SUU8_9ACTN|nr:AraC family transcriptional regulator [Gordonia crocea]GED96422.1 putative transcriptional regulator, AraC [Gordonia crocea]